MRFPGAVRFETSWKYLRSRRVLKGGICQKGSRQRACSGHPRCPDHQLDRKSFRTLALKITNLPSRTITHFTILKACLGQSPENAWRRAGERHLHTGSSWNSLSFFSAFQPSSAVVPPFPPRPPGPCEFLKNQRNCSGWQFFGPYQLFGCTWYGYANVFSVEKMQQQHVFFSTEKLHGPNFVTNFTPNFWRIFRVLFPGKRRRPKIRQKSRPLFAATRNPCRFSLQDQANRAAR